MGNPVAKQRVDPSSVLEYVNMVLGEVFHDTSIYAEAAFIPYPSCCKIPIAIALDKEEQLLLWYYRDMPARDLLKELASLLSDMSFTAYRFHRNVK